MFIQKLWKNYSYVILLFIITFICGLIYVHLLSNETVNEKKDSSTENYVVKLSEADY